MLEKEALKLKIDDLRECLLSELSLLKEASSSVDLEGRAKEVRIVIASACSTGSALYKLGDKSQYFYAEMNMLARAFIEKITNFCYLQICSDEEYKKFLLHPFYRAFHNTDKEKYSGNKKIKLQFSGREELRKDPKIREALKVFSETNPRKDWSDLGIDQKVALIGEKTNISIEFFLLNTLSIYSNASESLHGSFYGCALPTGIFTFGVDIKDLEQVESHVLKNTALLFAQLGSMINETLRLLSKNRKLTQIFEKSNLNQKKSLTLMKDIFQREQIF
jgi:hypothetical protein